MSNFIHRYGNGTFTHTLHIYFDNFGEEMSVDSKFFVKINAFLRYIEKFKVRPNRRCLASHVHTRRIGSIVELLRSILYCTWK